MILQLAKTTPYLTGQFKLDVELRTDGYEIYTDDCHVSPLSDRLGETDSSDVPFFSCKLSDHIRRLRKRLGDSFFSDTPSINSNGILYSDKWIDTYDHIYQAGVSRMRYQKYGKQFGLLCPVWTDSIEELLNTEFVFKIEGEGADIITAEHVMRFSPNLASSLAEYMSGLTSDLLNINLDRNEVTITGLEASTGTVITKEVSYALKNLLDRERPVIETDSMLCQLFPTNDIIARQLINFNFVFNMNDIMPAYSTNTMNLQKWKIWVDMRTVDGQDIEFRDIYTNYWSIPSYVSDTAAIGHFDSEKNALDYLEDNRCSDFIFMNKSTQPIVHWSLVENPSYLYNFYNGFSPVTIDQNGKETLSTGMFFDQPNPYSSVYAPGTNALTWCHVEDLSGSTDIQHVLNMMADDSSFTKFYTTPGKTVWINGMKFDFSKEQAHYPELIVNIVLARGPEIEALTGPYDHDKPVVYYHGSPVVSTNRRVSIIVDYQNKNATSACSLQSVLNGTFQSSLYNIAYPVNPANTALDLAIKMDAIFSHYIFPWKIEFNKSLYARKIDGPGKFTKEIQYYKSDINHNSCIYRYTGSLIPMMIDTEDSSNFNFDWFYKVMNQSFAHTDAGKEYNKNLQSGFSQEYPSINYFPLEPVIASYTPDPNRYPSEYEVKWYKNGSVYNLPVEVKKEFTVSSDSNVTSDFIYGFLFTELSNMVVSSQANPIAGSLTATNNFESAWSSQLKNAYGYDADWDYLSEDDITQLRFKVVYKLR